MQLTDYYKRLSEFLNSFDMLTFLPEEFDEGYGDLQINGVFGPLLSYILASKSIVYNRIENLYNDVIRKNKKEEINKRYEEYRIDALELSLTPQARQKYRQMLIVCLFSSDITKNQIIKLLERAYPECIINTNSFADYSVYIECGAYDIRLAPIHRILMLLKGIKLLSYDETGETETNISEFLKMSLNEIPLPYWNSDLDDCDDDYKDKCLKLSSYVEKTHMAPIDEPLKNAADFFYTRSQRNTTERQIKVPSLLDTGNTDPSNDIIFTVKIPDDAKKIIDDVSKNEHVRIRNEKIGNLKDEIIIHFILNVLRRNYISIEELMDTKITKEDWLSIFDAYDEALGGQCFDEDDDYFTLGLIIKILCKRINHSEAIADTLTDIVCNDSDEKNGSNPVSNQSSDLSEKNTRIEELEQELAAAKAKNKDLSKTINETKHRSYEEIKKLKEKIEILTEDLNDEKIRFEDLLRSAEEESKDEDPYSETDIEKMKIELNKKKLLFVGGHDSWQSMMLPIFPKSNFVKLREYNSMKTSIFKGVDYVIYNVNWEEHSMYYTVLKLKHKNTKIIFLNTNNKERTIRKLYEEICCVKDSNSEKDVSQTNGKSCA